MRLLVIKERLFLFGEFALSKSRYLYNKIYFLMTLNLFSIKTAQLK